MKVLLISPYSEKLVGGIINWTKYIVNYHREHGDGVELTLLRNERATQIFGLANPLKRVYVGLSNYLPVVRRFKKIIETEAFDVVHLSTSASLGMIRDLMIVREARKKGLKTVVHMHFGRIPQLLKSRGWEHFMLSCLLRKVDRTVVMDRFSLEALQENGFNNVTFVPNPLSMEVQNLIEEIGPVLRNRRKIIYAGHVLATKGVEELVKACRDIDNIQLELLGKVPNETYRQSLYKLAGNGADSWLNIPGNRPVETVIKEMKSCGVFVLPSYSEGFPNVILESMACGCPIIATPVGAIPEMLDADGKHPCGIIVPTKDVEKLRKAIVYLLENPEQAAELGRNAKERVGEEYGVEKVWNQLVDIWGQ